MDLSENFFNILVGPGQRKKRLKFGKDITHTVDKKKVQNVLKCTFQASCQHLFTVSLTLPAFVFLPFTDFPSSSVTITSESFVSVSLSSDELAVSGCLGDAGFSLLFGFGLGARSFRGGGLGARFVGFGGGGEGFLAAWPRFGACDLGSGLGAGLCKGLGGGGGRALA